MCWLVQNAASTRLEELNVMGGLITIRNCGRDPAFSAVQVSLIPSTVLSSAEIPSNLPLPRRKHFAMDSRERSPRKAPVYPAGMDWIGSLTKNLPPCPVDPDLEPTYETFSSSKMISVDRYYVLVTPLEIRH